MSYNIPGMDFTVQFFSFFYVHFIYSQNRSVDLIMCKKLPKFFIDTNISVFILFCIYKNINNTLELQENKIPFYIILLQIITIFGIPTYKNSNIVLKLKHEKQVYHKNIRA